MKRQANTLALLECRTVNADAQVARDLLWAAQDFASRNDISYIRIWRYTPMIDRAVPLICRIARSSPPMMTYCYKTNRTLEETEWEATPGDGDGSVN
jgi:hypothetical protein